MVIANITANVLESLNLSNKEKAFLKEVLQSLTEEDFKNGDYYRKACEHMDREKSSIRKRIKKIINKVLATGTLKVSDNIKGKDFLRLLKEQLKDDNNG